MIFIFGGITVLLSLRMPLGTFRMAGPGLFPFCLGILLMMLSGVFLLKLFGQRRKTLDKGKQDTQIPGAPRQMVLFFGTMVVATLFFNFLGYPLVAFLLMLGLLRTLGISRWGLTLLISGFTAAGSYIIFVQWLQIPLPKGWIGL